MLKVKNTLAYQLQMCKLGQKSFITNVPVSWNPSGRGHGVELEPRNNPSFVRTKNCRDLHFIQVYELTERLG